MKVSIEEDLSKHHTFGISTKAKKFLEAKTEQELLFALSDPIKKKIVIGGGSNIVFIQDYDGLVIKNALQGKSIVRSFKHTKYVTAKGGENWHQFVLWCIKKKLGGIENLALIPGTVGAAPIQNIGAYGVELKDVFVKLKALEIKTGKIKTFWKKDCDFAYRNSFFKKEGKGQFVITEVTFKLNKKPHILNTSYGSILMQLQKEEIQKPTIEDVSKAVIAIRSKKLPDPEKIGNCGSFFKNPIISKRAFKELFKSYPNVPHYPARESKIKLAAAWLIDQCGWKGKKIGNVGCYKHQALVIINHGQATGIELQKLVKNIKSSVHSKFNINLEEEVNIV